MILSVDLSGTEAIRAQLQRIGGSPDRILAATAVKVEDFIEGEAAKHNKRGALVRSIYKRQIPGGWELGHDPQVAPHALFVHWGTKPHKIRPKNKRALRWAAGGRFFFAKEVNHPGYVGDPWLKRAAQQAPLIFSRMLADELNRTGA